MNKASTAIVTALITAVIVGGATYFWQTQNPTEATPAEKVNTTETEEVDTSQPTTTNTTNWSTFTSQEPLKPQFSINFPDSWEVMVNTFGTDDVTIGFHPKDVAVEAGWWSLQVNPKSQKSMEDLIENYGTEWPDRQEQSEKISVSGKSATKVMVSSAERNAQEFLIFIENGDKLYWLRGNTELDIFETFYKSLELK